MVIHDHNKSDRRTCPGLYRVPLVCLEVFVGRTPLWYNVSNFGEFYLIRFSRRIESTDPLNSGTVDL